MSAEHETIDPAEAVAEYAVLPPEDDAEAIGDLEQDEEGDDEDDSDEEVGEDEEGDEDEAEDAEHEA